MSSFPEATNFRPAVRHLMAAILMSQSDINLTVDPADFEGNQFAQMNEGYIRNAYAIVDQMFLQSGGPRTF